MFYGNGYGYDPETAGVLEDAGYAYEDAGAVVVRSHGNNGRRGRNGVRVVQAGPPPRRPPPGYGQPYGPQMYNPYYGYGQPIPGIRPYPGLIPGIPGVPQQFEGGGPTGLDTIMFPNNAAAGAELAAFARPNRPFQGSRLILSAIDEAGAAADVVVAVSLITVGDANVPTGSNPLPLTMFGAQATYIQLSFPTATPGVPIVVRYRLLVANGAADTVTVSGGIVGRTIF